LLCPSTIWKCLTQDLGYTLTVYNARASQRDEQLRREYKAALLQFDDPDVFVFLDETSRGRCLSRRRRSWSPRGLDNTLDEFFDSAEATYTLLAAADINGIIMEASELVERKKNDKDECPTRGTIDTDRFLLWLQQKLCPTLGAYGKPRSVVVMDNAPIHQDPIIRLIIEAAGAVLIYTAPYAPMDNPIEFTFHQYKSQLRRHHVRGQRWDWDHFCGVHLAALRSITRDNMINYYRKIGCIRNLPPSCSDAEQEVGFLLILLAHQKAQTRE